MTVFGTDELHVLNDFLERVGEVMHAAFVIVVRRRFNGRIV